MRSSLTERGRQLLRPTIGVRRKPLIPKAPPEPIPPELAWLGSFWEVKVYQALTERGVAFVPQVSYWGGASILGGARVDFVLLDRPMVIRVQGPWHELPKAQARDELQRLSFLALGYTVVDLWEGDVRNLDEALDRIGVPVRGA